MHVFYLDFEAVPKGRPRITRSGHCYTPSKTREFENMVRAELKKQFTGKPTTNPIHLNIRFYFKKSKSCKKKYMTQKPDLDNCIKAIGDAMNGIIVKDDCQVVSLDVLKAFDPMPRIEVSAYEFEE